MSVKWQATPGGLATSPEDRFRQIGDQSVQTRRSMDTELGGFGNRLRGDQDYWGPVLRGEYQDMIDGGYGLTPEQMAGELDLGGLSVFDPQLRRDTWDQGFGQRVQNWQDGAGAVRGAYGNQIQAYRDAINPEGSNYDSTVNDWLSRMDTQGFDILDKNDAEIMSVLDSLRAPVRISDYASGGPFGGGGYGGGMFVGGGGGAASVGGSVPDLKLSQRFTDGYFLTPEMQQDMVTQASMQTGSRWRDAQAKARDALLQSGATSGQAQAALMDRMNRNMGRDVDSAMLAARLTGNQEAASRLLNAEGIESDLNKTSAQLATQRAIADANLQDSALGRAFSASMQNAQIEAANARAAAELTSGNRQFSAGLLPTLGNRRLELLTGLGDTAIGLADKRDTDLSNRFTNLAREGYGNALDSEIGLLSGSDSMYRDNLVGRDAIESDTWNQGLGFSDARANRNRDANRFNIGMRAAGVQGGQGMYDNSINNQMGTFDLRNQNNANMFGAASGATEGLFRGKNTKPPSTLQKLGDAAIGAGFGALGAFIGGGGSMSSIFGGGKGAMNTAGQGLGGGVWGG